MGTGSLRVELGEILWSTSRTVGDGAGPRTLVPCFLRERTWEAKVKIGSIVVRCYEFDAMLAFWQGALGYEPREPEEDGWVVLKDPEGRGPNVSLDRVPEHLEPLGKTSRVHLDLYTTDQEGEVERLIGIGAKRYPQEYRPEDDFVVLEDPDGNRFCVVQVADRG
jgi:catechol 2,3-dioxygenase-like lactoylglutathione lyase family enzyme